jgi:hypothetical protein
VITSSVVRLLVRTFATPPGDPLAPVDQNPDAVREEACRLVSKNTSVCSPRAPSTPPSANSSGFDLSFLSLLLWLILGAAVVGLLYVLVRWVVTSRGAGRRRSQTTKGDDDEPDVIEAGAVAIDRTREPVDWRREADAHRRAGLYRDSVRCRYRALVGDLARQGIIDEIPGRTTGEERAQLRVAAPAACATFDAAADLFDGAWYGRSDVVAADEERFRSLESDVLACTAERRR